MVYQYEIVPQVKIENISYFQPKLNFEFSKPKIHNVTSSKVQTFNIISPKFKSYKFDIPESLNIHITKPDPVKITLPPVLVMPVYNTEGLWNQKFWDSSAFSSAYIQDGKPKPQYGYFSGAKFENGQFVLGSILHGTTKKEGFGFLRSLKFGNQGEENFYFLNSLSNDDFHFHHNSGQHDPLVIKQAYSTRYPDRGSIENYVKNIENNTISGNIVIDSFNYASQLDDEGNSYNVATGEFKDSIKFMTSHMMPDALGSSRKLGSVSCDTSIPFCFITFGNNFGSDEEKNTVINRNRQEFLVGVSRGIEFAADSHGRNMGGGLLPNTILNMKGPLVEGITRTNGLTTVYNYGLITDKQEKEDKYLDSVFLGKEVVELLGPRTSNYIGNLEINSLDEFIKYRISRSKDGYIGYKVAMSFNDKTQGQLVNRKHIELRGANSVAMLEFDHGYQYKDWRTYNNAQLINARGEYDATTATLSGYKNYSIGNTNLIKNVDYDGVIRMSGKNSIAMKWQGLGKAKSDDISVQLPVILNGYQDEIAKLPTGVRYYKASYEGAHYENQGMIILGKAAIDNDILHTDEGTHDKADYSVGMYLGADKGFREEADFKDYRNVTLPFDESLNTGEILLQDGIVGSIGIYNNGNTNIINKKLIKINTGKVVDENQALNTGMYLGQSYLPTTSNYTAWMQNFKDRMPNLREGKDPKNGKVYTLGVITGLENTGNIELLNGRTVGMAVAGVGDRGVYAATARNDGEINIGQIANKDDTIRDVKAIVAMNEEIGQASDKSIKAENHGNINIHQDLEKFYGITLNSNTVGEHTGSISLDDGVSVKDTVGIYVAGGEVATQAEGFTAHFLDAGDVTLKGQHIVGIFNNGIYQTKENSGNGNLSIQGQLVKGIINETQGQMTLKDHNITVLVEDDKAPAIDKTDSSLGIFNRGALSLTGGDVALTLANGNEGDQKVDVVVALGNEGTQFDVKADKLDVTVDGMHSVAIYNKGKSATEKAEMTIGKGTFKVNTRDNVKGTSIAILNHDFCAITLGDGVQDNDLTFKVGNDGLFLFTTGNGDDAGKVILKENVNVTLDKGATGFYLQHANVEDGKVKEITNMFGSASVADKNITLNMQDGSVVAILDEPTGDYLDLSKVVADPLIKALDKVEVSTSTENNNYISFNVHRGRLNVDESGEKALEHLGKVNFYNSKVKISENATLTSNQDGELLFFQSEDQLGTNFASITNNGSLSLTGNSTGDKTTTAIAGKSSLLANNGTINLSGEASVGIFSANHAVVNNGDQGVINLTGEKSVGVYAVNDLMASKAGDIATVDDVQWLNVNVTNANNISAESKHNVGVFVKNDRWSQSTNSGHTIFTYDENGELLATANLVNTGNIDFSHATESVALRAENVVIKNAGAIHVGEKSVAIQAIDSTITNTEDSTITLGNSAIAFDLHLTGKQDTKDSIKQSTFAGSVDFEQTNQHKPTVFNLVFNTGDVQSIQDENLTVNGEGKGYTYIDLEKDTALSGNAAFNYALDRELKGNDATFINAKNTDITLESKVTLNGSHGSGILADEGSINLTANAEMIAGDNQQKFVGLYALGSAINNGGKVSAVGKNSVALYAMHKDTNHLANITQIGQVELGNNATGLFFNGNNLGLQNGQITSLATDNISAKANSLNQTGIVLANNSNPTFNWTHQGTITLGNSEQGNTVGVGLLGHHHFTNNGKIRVGDGGNDGYSIGVYGKDEKAVIKNNGVIRAGKNAIAISGYQIATQALSQLNIGQHGLGVLSNGGDVDLQGELTLVDGADKYGLGLYHKGAGNVQFALTSLNLGKHNIALFEDESNEGGQITSTMSNVTLDDYGRFIFNKNANKTLSNNTAINTQGNSRNIVGLYSKGESTNTANLDFSASDNSIAILEDGPHSFTNNGEIKVGRSDPSGFFSLGMAARNGASVINTGTVKVDNDHSIGLYAAGLGSKAINNGTIDVNGKNGIGIYLGDGATGENNGEIVVNGTGGMAVYLGKDSIIKNYGTIRLVGNGSIGIYDTNKSHQNLEQATDNQEGSIVEGAVSEVYHNTEKGVITEKTTELDGLQFDLTTKPTTVSRDGEKIEVSKITFVDVEQQGSEPPKVVIGNLSRPHVIDESLSFDEALDKVHQAENIGQASSLGMYVDTSGTRYTRPIEGLDQLDNIMKADLIIGAEAADLTNADTIVLKDNLLKPYKEVMENTPNIKSWNILSGSLLWNAAPYSNSLTDTTSTTQGSAILDGGVIMSRIPFTDLSADNEAKPFLQGLEHLYDTSAMSSKNKVIFNQLNRIGKNEGILLQQAIYQMSGNQYASTQRRIQSENDLFNREFNELMFWQNKSAYSHWKLKAFGESLEFISDTAGVYSHDKDAKGVMGLYQSENNKLAAYFGVSKSHYDFKDLGASTEKSNNFVVGMYQRGLWGDVGQHELSLREELNLSTRKMDRKFYVIDTLYQAENDYKNWGASLEGRYAFHYKFNPNLTLVPYAKLMLGYQKVFNTEENSDVMLLEMKEFNYHSIKPELGVMLKASYPIWQGRLNSQIDFHIAKDLAKPWENPPELRLAGTGTDFYKLQEDKQDLNTKVSARVMYEHKNVGFGLSAGYDFKQKTSNYNVTFKIKF